MRSLRTATLRASPSDEELMRRVQADDTIAFEALYDRYCARAYGLARVVCGDPQHAQDGVQEGFISIWRSRASFDPARGSARGWMLTLIRHRSIDIMRRRGGVRESGSDSEFDLVPGPGAVAEDVERADEAARLRASLLHLPVLQREVILLAYFGGLTHNEIAAQLRLPPGTVKGRMRLGLEKLRADARPLSP